MELNVLILVLMEDTLRDVNVQVALFVLTILILVLMEDTLREGLRKQILENLKSLNPCFNGRYSQSERFTTFSSDLTMS